MKYSKESDSSLIASDNVNSGHRNRLKERFMLKTSIVNDYELLELILFNAIPRKDVKPLAKSLLKKYLSLNCLINTDPIKLLEEKGVTNGVIIQFAIIKESIERILKDKLFKKNIIDNWKDLQVYLKATMGNSSTEKFRILYLNNKNIILADELNEYGTVDHTTVYPREILKKVLYYEATSIILVHNHPSGDPSPSKADIVLTQRIQEACSTIGVKLHDHVIVSAYKIYSFRANNLL